jgi:hypothetical protein
MGGVCCVECVIQRLGGRLGVSESGVIELVMKDILCELSAYFVADD